MAFENERKFLLKNDSWRKLVRKSSNISQGYIDILEETISLVKHGTRYSLLINVNGRKILKKISKKDFYLLKRNLHREQKVLRVRDHDDTYPLTIKIDIGIVGSKIEVEPYLNKEEFDFLFNQTSSSISKVRHYVDFKNHTFEIDEFKAQNAGLILAEVEVVNIKSHVELPDWIGEEVTTEDKYYNINLSKK